ncbi:MAG TPA: hypothetical protein VGS17_00920 [Candidatus Limnocylindria bacterium]|nr:hypothetical protein [Candidatus Limnocylindria bacterium]
MGRPQGFEHAYGIAEEQVPHSPVLLEPKAERFGEPGIGHADRAERRPPRLAAVGRQPVLEAPELLPRAGRIADETLPGGDAEPLAELGMRAPEPERLGLLDNRAPERVRGHPGATLRFLRGRSEREVRGHLVDHKRVVQVENDGRSHTLSPAVDLQRATIPGASVGRVVSRGLFDEIAWNWLQHTSGS